MMAWSEFAEAVGAEIEETGGNCRAYRVTINAGSYLLITDTDGPDLPYDGDMGLVCMYHHDRPEPIRCDGRDVCGYADEMVDIVTDLLALDIVKDHFAQ